LGTARPLQALQQLKASNTILTVPARQKKRTFISISQLPRSSAAEDAQDTSIPALLRHLGFLDAVGLLPSSKRACQAHAAALAARLLLRPGFSLTKLSRHKLNASGACVQTSPIDFDLSDVCYFRLAPMKPTDCTPPLLQHSHKPSKRPFFSDRDLIYNQQTCLSRSPCQVPHPTSFYCLICSQPGRGWVRPGLTGGGGAWPASAT
jgi:hypothetical protein